MKEYSVLVVYLALVGVVLYHGALLVLAAVLTAWMGLGGS